MLHNGFIATIDEHLESTVYNWDKYPVIGVHLYDVDGHTYQCDSAMLSLE